MTLSIVDEDGRQQLGRFEGGKWIPIIYPRAPETTLYSLDRRLNRLEGIIGSSLHYHADIHTRSATEVIIAGELNGRDFVGRYLFGPAAVPELLNIIKELGHVIQRGRVDVPYPFPREMF